MKREISEIEAKRVEQHQEMTDDQVFNDDNDDVNYHDYHHKDDQNVDEDEDGGQIGAASGDD